MQANANTVRRFDIFPFCPAWGEAKEWAKRTFTQEKTAEVSLVAATLVLIGYLACTIYQGVQNYMIFAY